MSASNNHDTPDPYQEEPILEEVPVYRLEELQKQAKRFAKEHQLLKEEPFFSKKHYYIVSAKWLRRWKKFVSFEEVTTGQQPSKLMGCGQMPKLNEDIVQAADTSCFNLPPRLLHLDVKLKPDLAEHRDYEFVSSTAWEEIFDSKYDNIEVKRFVVDTPDGQKVELYFKTIKFIPLWNNLLKDVEQERISKLPELSMQFSHHVTLKQFGSEIQPMIQKYGRKECYGSSFPRQDFLRFWILPEGTRKSILYNSLQLGAKANPSFTYKLFLEGDLQDEDAYIRDIDFLPDVLVVLEMREMNEKWLFFNLKHKLEAPCSYCKKVSLLNFVCSCKHAVYCTRDCKQSDKGHHKYRCPNDAESDDEEKELVMSQNSKKGLAGLRNLGNTCFMNSGLQCLSHIQQLTSYFLTGQYLKHINKTNPLGTQGQLSTQYAKMVKNLWLGEESSFSPTHLKKSIAKFQPMFSGYNQHDSGQLITYLLDGLHEDLNRVIQKPYTSTPDYDGRPDETIAKQSWEVYLKRNQSIIVDLMYGQYKSMVQCPNENCKYLSVTFDPFSVCSLPLVDNSKKSIELVILKDHIYSKKVNYSYTMEKEYLVEDKLEELRTLMKSPSDARVMMYIASYTSCQAIGMKEYIDDVRKEYKYRTIFIRELEPFEKPEEDIKVMLGHVIPNPYYSDETYRKNIVPFQMVFANLDITNKQFYHLVIKKYTKILESLGHPTNPEELLTIEEDKEPIRLLLITSSRYFNCSYCDKKNCPGCKLPYDDSPFKEYVHYNPESQYGRDKRIEMELYWRKNEKEVEKVFDQLGEQSDNMKHAAGVSSYKPPSVSIQQCLEMFEKEEVLGVDNEWFCPKCQDFVLAKKQLKIYKAPQILIFCLKRFKRKDYFSEKIGTLVDFPVNGLDMSNYVCHPDIPNDIFKDENVKMEVEHGSLNYDLIGISNHFGSTGGGHYTGYCKDPNSGDWYDFDDSCVSKLKGPEDVVSESAYILFYRRRQ